jgi:hypothetical protein
MKQIILGFSLFASTSLAAQEIKPLAQEGTIRICTPSRAGMAKNKPLVVVYSGKKHLEANDTALQLIKPETIKSIEVLKDSAAVGKHGESARFGVIEVYLNKEKYPKVYNELKKKLKAEAKKA